MGKIVLFMGPSSSGKDTILQHILANNVYHFQNIVLHTTRPPRIGEEDGREYYFCDEEKMIELERSKKIIELRKYHTQYGLWCYFTASSMIDLRQNNYITTNTLVGYDQYLNYYGKDQLVSILFDLDPGLRLRRALAREEAQDVPRYQEMCRRFLADSEDFSEENIKSRNIDAVISNNSTLENTISEVNKVLSKHL